MAEQILIVVSSEKEKEHGQILKNILSASGIYEAVLWTVKQYTENEPNLTSSKKIIFIGENDVSKRNISSINWKFEAPNMKYGWFGSVAMLTVGDKILSNAELKNFKEMCEEQTDNLKKGTEGISSSIAKIIGMASLLPLLAPISIIAWPIAIAAIKAVPLMIMAAPMVFTYKIATKLIDEIKKLPEQKKEQYSYLINRFVLNDIDNYIGLNK